MAFRIWTLISLRPRATAFFPYTTTSPNEKYHHRGNCFTKKYHLLYLSVCEHTMRGTEQGWAPFYRWGNRGWFYVESDACMYYALHIIPVFTDRKRKLRATKLPTHLHILYIHIMLLQCTRSHLTFIMLHSNFNFCFLKWGWVAQQSSQAELGWNIWKQNLLLILLFQILIWNLIELLSITRISKPLAELFSSTLMSWKM